MRVALVQLMARDVRSYEEAASHLLERLRSAARDAPDFIVLPECAYPAYMLELDPGAKAKAIEGSPRLLERVQRIAAGYGVYVILGLAERIGGALSNSAVAIGRDGSLLARASKSNLWHFDHKSFSPGTDFPVFDTEFGPMGMMVCADGRIPEVARILALRGARVIFDVVNLVSSARTPQALENQQHLFMLRARAQENGVHIAVCNKCGVEAGMITYLGRSFLACPDGSIAAECAPDREETLICEFEPEDAPRAQRMAMRHPELYGAILTRGAPPPRAGALCALIARFQAGDAASYAARATELARGAAIQDASLLVLPELPPPAALDGALLRRVCGALAPGALAVLAGLRDGERQLCAVSREGILGALPATHAPGARPAPPRVCELPGGLRIAALFDEEIQIPEIARCAMLEGANLLLCYDRLRAPGTLEMLRTRAAENKVFVLCVDGAPGPGAGCCIDPDGNVFATTLLAPEHAAFARLRLDLAADKDVVPGTNILNNRLAKYYEEMTNHV